MKRARMSQRDIDRLPITDLVQYLDGLLEEIDDLPYSLESAKEMETIQRIISQCDGLFSYFSSMALKYKLLKKQYKANGETKHLAGLMMDKEETFRNYAEIVKFKYAAASRLLTTKQIQIERMKMLDMLEEIDE